MKFLGFSVLLTLAFGPLSAFSEKAVDASLMVLGKDRLWYFDLQRKPFTGKAESFHENGKKKFTANYVTGVFDGEVLGWFADEKPASKQTFAKGKPIGLSQLWYSNGELRKKATFKDGLLEGEASEWYENGKLKEQVTFLDGKRTGDYKAWLEAGVIRVECGFRKMMSIF